MRFLEELWVNEEVEEMMEWAEEQEDYPVDEPWFTLFFRGSKPGNSGVKVSPKDYPKNYRMN